MRLQSSDHRKGVNKSQSLLRHVTGWTLFIVYETGFVYITTGKYVQLPDSFIFYILNITLFYFNAYLILPFSFDKSSKSYLTALLTVIIEMSVYLLIKYLLDYGLDAVRQDAHVSPISKYIILNLWRGLYFLGFSTLYWSVERMINFKRRVYEVERQQLKAEREKIELEKNLAESQNAYLHHQINPHFLFNTLNFIYNTFYKYSEDAAHCVMLLSDILRYSLEEVGTEGKTGLFAEVEQIAKFIKINRYRYDYELYIDYKVNGNLESLKIIPLILLTLTENIFKHGNLKRPESGAKLYITVDTQNELTFYSWNLKKNQEERRRIRSIGIKNTIKRLEYSYQHQYKLKINEKEKSYELELKMQL